MESNLHCLRQKHQDSTACRQKRRTAPQNYCQGRGRAANIGKRCCICIHLSWKQALHAISANFNEYKRLCTSNLNCRGLYHCNYCQKDITGVVRIKCAVCPDFDLCLDCFSVGAEITPHQNNHAYRVMDSLSFPLFHPDWGVRHLILLTLHNMKSGWTVPSMHHMMHAAQQHQCLQRYPKTD